MSQFLRFYRRKENKEILINVNSIWKIEVSYVREGDENYFPVSLKQGLEDAAAIRWYHVYAGSEVIKVVANPDDPVTKVLEDIYNNAIKG